MAKAKKVRHRGRRGGGSVRFHHGQFRARIGIGGGKYKEEGFVPDERGERDTDALKAAWAWIAGIILDRRRQKLGEPEPERFAPPRTLDELAAAYTYAMTRPLQRERKPWRPGTLRHFNGHYNGAISEAFGDRIASTITTGEIKAFLDAQLGRPLLHRYGKRKGTPSGRVVGHRTVRHFEDILQKLFRWACSHGPGPDVDPKYHPDRPVPWLKLSPMASMVTRTKVPKKTDQRWLRPPELRALLDAAASRLRFAEIMMPVAIEAGRYVTLYERNLWTARRDVAFVTTLIFTGLRQEELFEARWNWVDFERGLFWVKRAKVGDMLFSQRVALAPRAAAALRAWAPAKDEDLSRVADQFIFPGFDRAGGPKAARAGTRRMTDIGRPLEQLLRQAGIEPAGLGLHPFRHTFATLLAGAGVREDIRQALLRHVNRTMTDHYTHREVEEQAAALELLEAQVMREGVLRVITNTTKTGTAG